MKSIRFNPLRVAAAVAMSAALLTGSISTVWANPTNPEEMKQNWVKHRQEWVKARMAKMADRLEIKSSQQAAWQAYAKVVEEPMDIPAMKPDTPMDAAAMTRMRADVAAMHAKKMAQIADATAKLQEALSPDQRKTLDQMIRRAHHRGQHRMMHREHRMDDGHGWMQKEH